jgi:hypothetical protein
MGRAFHVILSDNEESYWWSHILRVFVVPPSPGFLRMTVNENISI